MDRQTDEKLQLLRQHHYHKQQQSLSHGGGYSKLTVAGYCGQLATSPASSESHDFELATNPACATAIPLGLHCVFAHANWRRIFLTSPISSNRASWPTSKSNLASTMAASRAKQISCLSSHLISSCRRAGRMAPTRAASLRRRTMRRLFVHPRLGAATGHSRAVATTDRTLQSGRTVPLRKIQSSGSIIQAPIELAGKRTNWQDPLAN